MLSDEEIWNQAFIALNYFYPVIVTIGTIANILAFIIFSRKRFENTIFSTYFRFLLVVDTIGLVYLALGKFLYFQFEINIRDFNESLCRLTLLLAYSVPPISAYLVVAISIDRWFTITKPTILLFRRKQSFQVRVCVGIIVANLIYNGQLFFSYVGIDKNQVNSTERICLVQSLNALQTMDLINSTIVPFAIMIISTILTVNSVFDSRKKIRQSRNQNNSSNQNQIRKRDTKFAITSIAINIIFLILNLPFALSTQIPNTLMPDYQSDIILVIFLLFTYLNHGMVFFINISVNNIFLEEFKILFNIFN